MSQDPQYQTRYITIDVASVIILVLFWALFALQRSPATFYIYICFPVYFWQQVLRRTVVFLGQHRYSKLHGAIVARVLLRGCLVISALQSMVVRRRLVIPSDLDIDRP